MSVPVASHAAFQPYKTAAERAYYELKRRILTCSLAAGSRISEKRLASEIGVPRDPLRSACRRLQRERLIHPESSRQYRVTPLRLTDIRELNELRRIVESKAAALAAERARPDQIARLLILAELNYQPGQRQTYMQYLSYNTAFHLQLARAARNTRLETTVVSVLDQIQRPMYLGLDLGLNREEATAEHLSLVDAVRHRRASLAYRLMWNQLSAGEKRMIEACGDNGRR